MFDFRRFCARTSESGSSAHSIPRYGRHESEACDLKDAVPRSTLSAPRETFSSTAYTASLSSCPSSFSSASSFASFTYRGGIVAANSGDIYDQRVWSANARAAPDFSRHVQFSGKEHQMGPRHAASGPCSREASEPNLRVRSDLADDHSHRSVPFMRLPPPRPITGETRQRPKTASPQRGTTIFDARSSFLRQRQESSMSVFSTSCSRSSSCSSSCSCSGSTSSISSSSPPRSALRSASGKRVTASNVDGAPIHSLLDQRAPVGDDVAEKVPLDREEVIEDEFLEKAVEGEFSCQVPECSPREDSLRDAIFQWRLPEAPGVGAAVGSGRQLQKKAKASGHRGVGSSRSHTSHFWMRHLAPQEDIVPGTFLDFMSELEWTTIQPKASDDACLWAPDCLWAGPKQRSEAVGTSRYISRQTSPLRSLSRLPQPPEDKAAVEKLWHEAAEFADVDVTPTARRNPSKHAGVLLHHHSRGLRGRRKSKLQKHVVKNAQDNGMPSETAADPWSTFVDDADEQPHLGHSMSDSLNPSSWSLYQKQALGEWKSKINMLKVRRKRLKEAAVEQAKVRKDLDEQEDVVCEVKNIAPRLDSSSVPQLDASADVSNDPMLSSGDENWCHETTQQALELEQASAEEAKPLEEPPIATWRYHRRSSPRYRRRSSQFQSQAETSSQRRPESHAESSMETLQKIKEQAVEKVKAMSFIDALTRPATQATRRAKLLAHADTGPCILEEGAPPGSTQGGARNKPRNSNETAQTDEPKNKSLEPRRTVKFTEAPEYDSREARKSSQRLKMATGKILNAPEVQKRVVRKSMQSMSKQLKRLSSSEISAA